MKLIFAPALAALFFLPNLAPAQTDAYHGTPPNYRGTLPANSARLVRTQPEGYIRTEPAAPGTTRIPDYRTGQPSPTVMADILSSDAYYTAAGGTSPGYVVQVYRDVIGREPLPVEINYWMGRLRSESRRDLAYQLLSRYPKNVSVLRAPAPVYDPGYLPDPASPTFRDPSGPFFHDSYYFNYEKSRSIRAFGLNEQG
ncbi:MAG: DUF4214 domain-containing protein [Gemmataceae bacterium]